VEERRFNAAKKRRERSFLAPQAAALKKLVLTA
jgi:hypothetical protein